MSNDVFDGYEKIRTVLRLVSVFFDDVTAILGDFKIGIRWKTATSN